MTRDDDVRELLEDSEESFWAMDYLPMYEFAWTVRGFGRGHTPDEVVEISRAAYDLFVERHTLKRVWTRWPIDLDAAWPVEPGTPLDFDLDPDEDVSVPLQVLVPDEG